MFGLTYLVLGIIIKLNILIVGATGFIGSKLANTLRSRGDCVYVLSRCSTDSVWVINEFDSARGNICQLSLGDNFRFECSNNLKMLNLDYFLHGACGLVPSSNQQDFFKESVVCKLRDISDIMSKDEILKSLNERTISCRDVTFRIFGLSLTSINIFISLIITFILFKIYITHEKKKF